MIIRAKLAIGILICILQTAYAQQARINELLTRGNEVSEFSPDSALLLFKQALGLAIGKDTVLLPRIYNRFAQAYSMKGNYTEAARFLVQALKKAEVLKDTIALIDGNNNMGIDWMYQEDYEKALTYFHAAEELAALSRDSLRWGHALNNLGLTVGYMGQSKEELQYYNRAATIFKRINELEGYANTILNTATILTAEKRHKEAEVLYKQALESYRQMDYANAQSMVFQGLAENARDAGNYRDARNYIRQAIIISKTHGYETERANGLLITSEIFKKMKQFDSAYFYLDQHRLLRNEIFNSEKNKISAELEAQYKTELKEQQIKDLQQENTIKDLRATTARQWQIGLVIMIVLISVVLGVLYNRYQLKQRTAKTLDDKNVELQKLNSFKDKMFAVISHDLRNPVDAFNTIMESLSQNSQHASKEELKEFLDSTLQSAKDLKGLLNNLLEWSLVQIGKLPFNPRAISLREVTQQSIAHVETMAATKKITIHNQINHDISVIADSSMIIIALRNLISNAIKFSEPGKPIELMAQSENGNVQLKVIDQGVGMSAEDVIKLFKMEQSTQQIGNSVEKGAGIGLLLVKELVERNQGRISVISHPGKGSTFVIELPQIA